MPSGAIIIDLDLWWPKFWPKQKWVKLLRGNFRRASEVFFFNFSPTCIRSRVRAGVLLLARAPARRGLTSPSELDVPRPAQWLQLTSNATSATGRRPSTSGKHRERDAAPSGTLTGVCFGRWKLFLLQAEQARRAMLSMLAECCLGNANSTSWQRECHCNR